MAFERLGKFAKRLRLQKGITQDELASHNLDVNTISSIERGVYTPSQKKLEILFERLGYFADNFFDSYLDNKAAKILEILYELEGLLEVQTAKKSDPIIAKIDALIEELENSDEYIKLAQNKQNIILLKAANAMNKRIASDIMRDMLLKALEFSIVNFKVQAIPGYFLTMQDRKILALMASTYSYEGRLKDAVDIMCGLKINLENHCIDRAELGRFYPWVIYTLAKYLLEDYRYEEALENCDIGLKSCKDTRSMYHYPHIAFMKATALGRLGRVEESEQLYLQVINALELFEMYDDIDEARHMIRTVLGKDL